MTPSDRDYLKVMIGTFVVPVLYFLGIVLFVGTGWAIIHAANNVSNLVLGALLFILGYNAFRFGWIWRA